MNESVVFTGKCSWFGGPDDEGVAPDEGLAFIYKVETKPEVFLATQPKGTSGLARRLNPEVYYVACRWDYENEKTTKEKLAGTEMALVTSASTNRAFLAHPTDWGPHHDTGRAADLSPGLLEALGLSTDAEVTVTYPMPPRPLLPQRDPNEPRVTKEKVKEAAKKAVKRRHERRKERRPKIKAKAKGKKK